jgi:hypothetical protein
MNADRYLFSKIIFTARFTSRKLDRNKIIFIGQEIWNREAGIKWYSEILFREFPFCLTFHSSFFVTDTRVPLDDVMEMDWVPPPLYIS